MSRRRRPRSALRFAVIAQAAIAALTLVPIRVSAQTAAPNSGSDLLQPFLEGNPNNPPRFKRPGPAATVPADQAPPAGKFTAPSRIGATPVYGSPTGFGAGDTGFDSRNRPHRMRVAKTPPKGSELAPAPQTTFNNVPAPPPQVPSTVPVLPPPPPPQVYPLKAANRRGAVLPPPPEQLPGQQSTCRSAPPDGGEPPGCGLADSVGGAVRRLGVDAAAGHAAAEYIAARHCAAAHVAHHRRSL